MKKPTAPVESASKALMKPGLFLSAGSNLQSLEMEVRDSIGVLQLTCPYIKSKSIGARSHWHGTLHEFHVHSKH